MVRNSKNLRIPFETDQQRTEIIAKCRLMLEWVYTTDREDIDISNDYHIPIGETAAPESLEELRNYIGYLLKTEGRRGPVSILTSHIAQRVTKDQERLLLLITELSEADLYRRQGHITPILNRTCPSLQQILNERLETDLDLSPVIRKAGEENEINDTELRLAQFVRLCRNDIAHNHPFDPEYSFWVHKHGARAAIALLNSLRESWYDFDWYVENDLSPENCVKVIEMEFEFEWNPDKSTYEWQSLKDEYVHKGF